MKIAVTGATGFVGQALLARLLDKGCAVVALARQPSRIADQNELTVIPGDLDDETALAALCEGADALIHLAGVTHARREADYQRVNVAGARRAAIAAASAGARLVHASSLSARAPHLSAYAQSKRESETAVAEGAQELPWIALRLPAIYGPGDRATLPYFKLVRSGLALEPKTDPAARVSLLYVDDAAGALIAAARTSLSGAVYEVGDETAEGREWREIGETLGNIMQKNVKRIAVPRPAVAASHAITRAADRAMGRSPSVRSGQINEFFHPDWVARENLFSDAAGWRALTPLEEGFAKTIRWYQDNALL